MPPSTIYVGRPSRWGNPWTVQGARQAGFGGSERYFADLVVGMFDHGLRAGAPICQEIIEGLPVLRGKHLACWCRLDWPCHADTLLLLANRPLQCEGMDA